MKKDVFSVHKIDGSTVQQESLEAIPTPCVIVLQMFSPHDSVYLPVRRIGKEKVEL